MSMEQAIDIATLDERTQEAVHELQRTIAANYPTTVFSLQRNPEDPSVLHLLAVVDVDDPDVVGDLVVDRLVTLQVEQSIPLHVIPLRTPERVRDALAAAPGVTHRAGRATRLWGGGA